MCILAEILPYCEEQINSDGIVSTSSRLEFSSPIQVTPLFRSLAAGIPSPQFSESVSHPCALALNNFKANRKIISLMEITSMIIYY